MARKGLFRREFGRYRALQKLITEIESDSELVTFKEVVGSELAHRGRARVEMFDKHFSEKGGHHEP